MANITAAQKKAMNEIAAQTEHGYMDPDLLDQRTLKALRSKGFIHDHPNGLLVRLSDEGRTALENVDKPKPVSEAAADRRFLALPEEEQQERLALRAEFMFITRGVNAYKLSQLMCHVTSGIDWCGCTKGHLGDQWLEVWTSYRRDFTDSTLSYFVKLLDEYLAGEAERERASKVYSATMDHRDVIDWAHEDSEKQQRQDIHECAEVELAGLPGMDSSRSRAGLARRGYMEKKSNGRYYLTRKGWAAAARSFYFASGRAQSKRNGARRNLDNWSYRGDKNEQKRIVVEQDREYRSMLTLAERALWRSEAAESVSCTVDDCNVGRAALPTHDVGCDCCC